MDNKLIQARMKENEFEIIEKAGEIVGLARSSFLRSASLKEARLILKNLNGENEGILSPTSSS